MWNNLPQKVLTAPTVNCFKRRFHRYSAENRYSTKRSCGPPKSAEEMSISLQYDSSTHEDRSTGILPTRLNDDDDDDDDDDVNKRIQRQIVRK